MAPLFAQEGELQLQGGKFEKCTLILSENEIKFHGEKHHIAQLFDAASCQIERVTVKQKILLWSVPKEGVKIYFTATFAPCFFFKQSGTIDSFFTIVSELKSKCLKESEETKARSAEEDTTDKQINAFATQPKKQIVDFPASAKTIPLTKQETRDFSMAEKQTEGHDERRHIINKKLASDANRMLDDLVKLRLQADALMKTLKKMERAALTNEKSNQPFVSECTSSTRAADEAATELYNSGEKTDMTSVESTSAETSIDDLLKAEESVHSQPISEGKVERELSWKAQYIQTCQTFGDQCIGNMMDTHVSFEEDSDNDSEVPFLFDLGNCRFSHMLSMYRGLSMPLYFYKMGRLIKCNKNGFYQEHLLSPYMLLIGNTFDGQNEILRHGIEDSIQRHAVQTAGADLMCLMPDVLDDFHHALRDQLIWKGTRLFPVPRSIALAYSVYRQCLLNNQRMSEDFLCLDYDGEELTAIKITRAKDKNGNTYFIRWGQQRIEGEHPSYRSLAEEYIKCYKDKYHVPLTQAMKDELINTKLLQQLLLTDGSTPILLANEGCPIDLWPDLDIVAQLHDEVEKDVQAVRQTTGKNVYAVCSFGWANDRLFYGVDGLEDGCKEIRQRYQENKTLWEEYLPDLSLEVHRDGRFNDLELISEKDRHQRISMSYLNEKIQFTVNHGTIVLTKGKKHYDLPLIREVHGTVNREKMARFDLSKPLEEDTEVELHITYSYGDVDSYKLIATASGGRTFESYWCDTETLANNSPHYSPGFIKGCSSRANKKTIEGFREFVERVKAPAALKADMVYTYPKDVKQERPYSCYLEKLNGNAGFPFRTISQYFDRDNHTEEVCSQITAMLENGTFDVIAATLRGELPVNHRLEKGTSRIFPNADQAEILRSNLEQISREFGILYTYCEPAVKELVDTIRILKPEDRPDAIQTWAPITAYVTRKSDAYGVWNSFSKALKTLKKQGKYNKVANLRAISNVCYKTENWIFEFYHDENGKQNVGILVDCILSYLYDDMWKKTVDYNPRIMRDLLELLLCICMLKQEDPTILDSNEPTTKQLVRRLKQIDRDMRMLEERGVLKYKFDSRIRGYTLPMEYRRVNPVIYCLVQTLSGGESINLVGFEEG